MIRNGFDWDGVFDGFEPIARSVVNEKNEVDRAVQAVRDGFAQMGWISVFAADLPDYGTGVVIGLVREEITRTPDGPVVTVSPEMGRMTYLDRKKGVYTDHYAIALGFDGSRSYGPTHHFWVQTYTCTRCGANFANEELCDDPDRLAVKAG